MRLRTRIHFQQNTPTIDAAGEPVESWSTYRNACADIQDMGGSQVGPPPVEGVVMTRAVIRYPHRGRIPQPIDRFRFKEGDVTRTIEIESVERLDNKRQFMEVAGSEVQE